MQTSFFASDACAQADSSHFRRIEQVNKYIEDNYVEEPDYQKITEKAVSSMLAELDPHSIYIPARDVQRTNEGLQANFEGVGIAFQIVDDLLDAPAGADPAALEETTCLRLWSREEAVAQARLATSEAVAALSRVKGSPALAAMADLAHALLTRAV